MDALLAWIENTAIARATAESVTLTASLSALHLLGFTLVTGGALVANLKLLGMLFPQSSTAEVLRPVNRAIVVGLAISVLTGALLFSGRAILVSANGTFQLKMLLLLTAAVFHFAVNRGDTPRATVAPFRVRIGPAVGLSLWIALAVAACAFILLE